MSARKICNAIRSLIEGLKCGDLYLSNKVDKKKALDIYREQQQAITTHSKIKKSIGQSKTVI